MKKRHIAFYALIAAALIASSLWVIQSLAGSRPMGEQRPDFECHSATSNGSGEFAICEHVPSGACFVWFQSIGKGGITSAPNEVCDRPRLTGDLR